MARGARGGKRQSGPPARDSGAATRALSRKARPTSDHLAHWETAADIPDNAEDRFHNQRDNILLDGTGSDSDGDDDDAQAGTFSRGRQVLGIDVDDEPEEDDEEGEEDDADDASDDDDDEMDHAALPQRSSASTAAAAAPASSDDDDEEEDSDASIDPEDEVGGWGPHKRAYYNANNLDAIGSDEEMGEEERREMEVREARKLQAKLRQEMDDDDFGLAEAELDQANEGTLSGSGKAARERRRAELDGGVASSSSTVQASSELPKAPLERAKLLAQVQRTTPETIALAGDFADVVDELNEVTVSLKQAAIDTPDHERLGLMHIHHQTLVTYVTTLTFYFHLRSLPEYVSDPTRLSQHPVVQRLVKLKSGLATLEDLGCSALEPAGEAEEEGDLNSEEERWLLGDPNRLGGDSDGESESLGSLESDELAGLLADEKENVAVARRQPKNGKESPATAGSKQGKEKKAKKQEKAPKAAAPLASLASIGDDDVGGSLSASSSKRARRSGTNGKAQYSDELAESFGEPTALGASDAADKAARRKSLQFYTGQISAKEARRGDAARKSLGGDSDIPYRDRERSRMVVAQTAANRAAKASSRESADMELDGEAFGEEDLRDWRDVMGQDVAKGVSADVGGTGQDEDEDYYDLVASRQRQAKKAKKDEYEAARDEERFIADPTLDPGAHRGINRQIEKNRGLTPRRPKSVRNPRVKKRQKFDKAQKKLSSTRAVYKGGAAALEGGYGGEKSGISNVVKSRSFG